MDDYASKEVMEEKFKSLEDKLDENSHATRNKVQSMQNVLELRMNIFERDTRESLTRIEIQTTQHNGRMRWLEKMVWLAIGGLAILSTVVLPLGWVLISAGRL